MYVQRTLPDNNLINFQLKKLVSIYFKNICFFIHHLAYEKEARYIKWEFNVRVNKTNKTCYRAKWTHKKHKLCFCILNISLLQMRAIWICIKTEWERIEREVENFCLSQQCHHTIFFVFLSSQNVKSKTTAKNRREQRQRRWGWNVCNACCCRFSYCCCAVF